jgi:membrane protein implicated in regulation of membrane protease activity
MNAAWISLGGAVVLTLQTRSLAWFLNGDIWAFFGTIFAVLCGLALLYEWRCRRRRLRRTRGYRLEIQRQALQQDSHG